MVRYKNQLYERQIEYLNYIKSCSSITTTELAKVFGITTSTASTSINRLMMKGVLKRIDNNNKDGRDKFYSINYKGLSTICFMEKGRLYSHIAYFQKRIEILDLLLKAKSVRADFDASKRKAFDDCGSSDSHK